MEMSFTMDDDGTVQTLYNLIHYFARYKELEALSSLYNKMKTKHPDFANPTTGTDEEKALKVEAMKIIRGGASEKGLL
jgi:hypothetical protein